MGTTASYTMELSPLSLLLYILCAGVSAKEDEPTIQFTTPPWFKPINDTASNQTYLEVRFILPGKPKIDYATIFLYKNNVEDKVGTADKLPDAGEPVVIRTELNPCYDSLNLFIGAEKPLHVLETSEKFDYDSSKFCKNRVLIDSSGSNTTIIMVSIVCGVLVLVLGGLIGVIFIIRKKKTEAANTKVDQNPEYGATYDYDVHCSEIYDRNNDYYGMED